MTASMVTLCDNPSIKNPDLDGVTYLIVPADVHDHDMKVMSIASAVFHAPVQVCLSALHCTSCMCLCYCSMKQLGLLLSESSVNHDLFLLATVPLHILSACDDLYRHVVGFVAGMHGC